MGKYVVLGLCGGLILFFGAVYVLYCYVFRANRKHPCGPHTFPRGSQYAPYRDRVFRNIDHVLAQPWERVSVISKDGLKLAGLYCHHLDGAPLMILFHGYRSNGVRDGNGGFLICEARKYNVLLVDERAHGDSQGRTITFGVKERLDCLSWVEYARERFGKDTKILLVGVSMGAATVMMASALLPPESVRGIIADCGYTSPKEIMMTVARQIHVPAKPAYALLRLGARLFGHFDPEEGSAIDALRRNRIPILLIHGEDDRFVPCDMSRRNFDACGAKKWLLTVPGAGHGMSYYVDTPAYTKAVAEFCDQVL